MDVTKEPGYAEAYDRILTTYGPVWAERFAFLAPLMFEDVEGPVARAFLYGLDSSAAGSSAGEDVAWNACQSIVDEMGARVVQDAERMLGAEF